jgi:hypothetical protein
MDSSVVAGAQSQSAELSSKATRASTSSKPDVGVTVAVAPQNGPNPLLAQCNFDHLHRRLRAVAGSSWSGLDCFDHVHAAGDFAEHWVL